MYFQYQQVKRIKYIVQCNLDLVTLNLVTACDLVSIFQRPFFNLLNRIIRFSDIMQFSNSFCVDQNWHYIEIALYSKSTLISFGSYCSWLSYFFLCLCYQNWHDKVLDYIVPVLPLASCNVVFALSYNAEWLAVIVFIILV